MRLLLFDVDGTLVVARGAGRKALRAAMLETYGLTGPIDDHDFRGKTDPAIVRELLRAAGWGGGRIDASLAEVWGPYLRHLEAALTVPATRPFPCPGVLQLLDRLAADDRYMLGLVTGNVVGGAERKLRAAGLDRRFSVGAFGSDAEEREELPPLAVARASRRTGRRLRAEDAVVLGDTPADVRCARQTGARAVAIATGGYGVEQLRSSEPDLLLEDLSDTEAVLAALEELAMVIVAEER